jgi:tryptophanyl-tRNA synthetase
MGGIQRNALSPTCTEAFAMQRVLSGIQPSGDLHLGNYFGMMSRMVEYQRSSDLFAMIVNYHALTTIKDKALLEENTLNAAMDFLALGLDPERSTFWVQGDVPEVTELTWMLACATNMGLLERATSYKDKISKGLTPNVGLFCYPLLMAADILCFGANVVPVGKDQKQHLEMTRDIAIRFNQIFGEVFIVPEPDIERERALVVGTDGQKMSKSYGNTLPIFGPTKKLRKRVMSIVTDSTDIDQPKNPDTALFHLFALFLNEAETEDLRARFEAPGLRYGDVKQELFEKFMERFGPYREKREDLGKRPDDVRDLLKMGAQKASAVARGYLDKARDACGLSY